MPGLAQKLQRGKGWHGSCMGESWHKPCNIARVVPVLLGMKVALLMALAQTLHQVSVGTTPASTGSAGTLLAAAAMQVACRTRFRILTAGTRTAGWVRNYPGCAKLSWHESCIVSDCHLQEPCLPNWHIRYARMSSVRPCQLASLMPAPATPCDSAPEQMS